MVAPDHSPTPALLRPPKTCHRLPGNQHSSWAPRGSTLQASASGPVSHEQAGEGSGQGPGRRSAALSCCRDWQGLGSHLAPAGIRDGVSLGLQQMRPGSGQGRSPGRTSTSHQSQWDGRLEADRRPEHTPASCGHACVCARGCVRGTWGVGELRPDGPCTPLPPLHPALLGGACRGRGLPPPPQPPHLVSSARVGPTRCQF